MALQIPAAEAYESRPSRVRWLLFDRFIFFLLFSIFLSHSVFAQAPQAPNLEVGHYEWTFRDGAPVTIFALAQGSDGSLWVGSDTGLFRFDGVRFETFKSPFDDRLLSTNISALLVPASGGLWIGYRFGGFSFLKDGHVKNYPLDSPASGTVWEFTQGPDGTVWAGTTSGVWRFEHSAWEHLGTEWNPPTPGEERLRFDREGTLWVIGEYRLFALRSGDRQFQVALKDLPTNDFVMDADGYVVTGPSAGQGRLYSNDGRFSKLPILGVKNAAIIDRTNSVWIVASDKPYLTRLPPTARLPEDLKNQHSVHPQIFQLDAYFTSRLVDREGNVWFGTVSGLDRFFYSPLIKQELPTPTEQGLALAADDLGAIWVGTNKQRNIHIHRIFEGKTETLLKEKSPELGCLYRAPDTTLWFGGIGGLWRLGGRNLVRIDLPPEILDQSRFLQSITQDRDGGMWISFGRHGLYRLADGVWTPYGGREDLPKTGVVIEFTDPLGRVWFGYTKNTLAVLDANQVKVFGPSDGLRVGNITAIYGRETTTWIGGEFGLQQYSQGQIHTINAVNEEWLRGISGIVETANGDLWLSGIFGIFRISNAELHEALRSPGYQVKGEHFGRREGLPAFAAQLRPLPTAIESADGRVWFALTNSVLWVDPVHAEHRAVPPPVTVQSVSANGQFYPPGLALRFPARTSDVQIGYAAVSLSDPEAIHFHYKLEEIDQDWHQVATATPVTYRNLPPGLYHFRVDATDTNGVWSDNVATAEFTILPAFYQTAWFRLLCSAAFLVLLWALYQFRVQQLAREFNARLKERTRIARELHDTLLQNLHGLLFRFQAARNMLPRRSEEAMEALDGAISRTEQAIAESQDAITDLRPGTATESDLGELVRASGKELETSANGNGTPPSFSVIVEGERRTLSPMLQAEVYRIARELLRNAFRHACARKVEAEIQFGDDQLRVRIRDDGKGIDPDVLKKGRRPGHWGILGVKERAEQIGAKLDFWSEPGAGTEVQLTIPAAKAYESRRSRVKWLSFGRFIFLLLFSLFSSQSLFAQMPQASNLQVGHDFWGFKEGAPADIMSIAQTSDGFLWLATPTGLFRFDGTRFERFRSPFGDQLLANDLRTVLAPPSGGLWIGYTFGGFSFLQNNGRLTNYGGEAASSGTVNRFAQGHNGDLWAGTTTGLWRFDGSLWHHLGLEWNAPATQALEIAFDSQGVLWALAGLRPSFDLLYLPPGTGHFQTAERNLHTNGFMLDANGAVVTGPQGKTPVPNSSSEVKASGYPIIAKDADAIIDGNRSIWVSSSETGLRRLPPSDQPYQAPNRPAAINPVVYPVKPFHRADLVDREGNVWFGDTTGLHRFFYSPLVRIEEVSKDAIWCAVAADDNGAVWIASGKRLRHFSHGRSDAVKKLDADFPNFAFRAPDKTFWFATDRELWHLAGRAWTRVALPPDMADQVHFLQTITQDSKGGMWISFGRHGLFRLANDVWTPYGGREDLPKTGVVIEFTDHQGRVWFGYTKNTLAVLDGDRVQVFGPSDGLRVGNVTAIYGRGTAIWIGGEFGLQQSDRGGFRGIHAVDDELLRGISGIVETANGDLWLNGISGIFHIPHTEISEARKDPGYRVKGEHFGRREGLLGLAFQLRPLNTAVEGTDARLWFTGSSGVVWLDPAQSEKKVPAPPTTILSVSGDDKFYPTGGALRLPAHTSNVQISYAAVSLSDPEAVSYRYKLQETDKDWHVVGTASPVNYRNLGPGSYHFRVDATDTNGVWSDKVATAEFTILPAFYQTAWFRLLCSAAFLVLLWGLYQFRVHQLAREFNAGLEERLKERTRIARELHDTLLQNLHGLLFRFQAARNMLPRRSEEAMEALDGAISRTEQAIAESQDAITNLRPGTVTESDLGDLVRAAGKELESAGEGNGAPPSFSVIVEGERKTLSPILQAEVFRIAHELLRNSFRHACARRIEAEVRYGDEELRVRIRDDGKGMNLEGLKKGRRPGHWGLLGVKERAEQIGAQLEFWSEPGAGTEVQLSIPAAIAYKNSHDRSRFKLLRRVKVDE